MKALRAAGECGRIVGAFASNVGLVRLVEVQYVTKQPQSERKTLYVITDHEPTLIVNNVAGLAKTAKVFQVPAISHSCHPCG